MEINFISSKDSNETRTMHIKCDKIEIMIGNDTEEIIKNLFESFLQKYQERLEKPMKKSEFVFDSVGLLYCKLHKISLNRGRSYINSPDWLKNDNYKCFEYAIAVALNH